MNFSFSTHSNDPNGFESSSMARVKEEHSEQHRLLSENIMDDDTINEDGKDNNNKKHNVTIRSAAATEPPVPNPLDKPDRAKKLTYDEIRKESLPTYSDSLGFIRKEYLETHLAIKLGKEKDRLNALKKKKKFGQNGMNNNFNKTEPEGTNSIDNNMNNDKFLKNKLIELIPVDDLRKKYGMEIDNILRLDEDNRYVSQEANLHDVWDANNQIMRTPIKSLLEHCGFVVHLSFETVAFLNLPRSGSSNESDHIGKGLVVLTKKKRKVRMIDGKQQEIPGENDDNFYLHFYKFDQESSMHHNIFQMGFEKLQYEGKKEEILSFDKDMGKSLESEIRHEATYTSQRISEAVFGSLSTSSIINAYHFMKSDTVFDISEVAKKKKKIETQGQNCCDNFDCCKCWCKIECCPCFNDCMKGIKLCCGLSYRFCVKCDCCSYEGPTNRNTINHFENGISIEHVHDLVKLTTLERTQRHRDRGLQVFNHLKDKEASLVGDIDHTEKVQILKGIELNYFDHISCTREKGVILCKPFANMVSVLGTIALINSKVVANTADGIHKYKSYERGFRDPLNDLELEQLELQDREEAVYVNAQVNRKRGGNPYDKKKSTFQKYFGPCCFGYNNNNDKRFGNYNNTKKKKKRIGNGLNNNNNKPKSWFEGWCDCWNTHSGGDLLRQFIN